MLNSETKKIYIVTAVHNRYKITELFIDHLLSQTYKDIVLVLVDDGCTDGTQEMVKSKMADAVILKGDGNLWWGGALHMGYQWLINNIADDDIVMFANDDTQFESDYLEIAADLINKNPKCMITGCGYNKFTNEQVDGVIHWDFKTGTGSGVLTPTDEGNCASTRSLFLTGEILRETGGFHPKTLPHYGSDYEWTIRAVRNGFRILSFEELKYTFDPGTTGDNDLEKLTVKKLFSKRSSANPIYKMNFIFLSTPVNYLPKRIGYQIGRYFGKVKTLAKIIGRKEKK